MGDRYELGSDARDWSSLRGRPRQQWGKLTDDDFDQVNGQREQLVGRVQERYGIAREEAERPVKDLEDRALAGGDRAGGSTRTSSMEAS
jgi:uncharacterized protein YjbJ (UPF0337 family)